MLARTTHCIGLLLFFFYGCGDDNPAQFSELEELVPLSAGNKWHYEVSTTNLVDSTRSLDTTYTIEISEEVPIVYDSDKIITYKWEGSDGMSFQTLARNTADGLCFYGGVSAVDTFLSKTTFLKYPVNVGETWDYYTLTTSSEGKMSIADTLLVECLSLSEELNTPAGTYSCILYHFKRLTNQGFILDFYWYVNREIGPVGIVLENRHKDYDDPIHRSISLLSSYKI